jgi:hypothetical protein
MDNLERQIKFANKEVEVFLKFVESNLKQKISVFPNEFYQDMDGYWGMNFDGITIMANEDFTEFEVGHEAYDSGSYLEPPTTDYVEHSKHKTLELALLAMLSLWVGMSYRNFRESQWAEECVGELEEEIDWSLD